MLTRSLRLGLAATLMWVVVACSDGQPEIVERSTWGDIFADAGVEATFALREVGEPQTLVWDPSRAAERRLPASTFKILNSLIALETGVLSDVDHPVAWDGVERDVVAWNRDHSLRSGIEVSAVWAFQDLARQVGEERMADLVARAGYGNGAIGGGIDRFWLTGDLRISPMEQLDFLEALVSDELPFRTEVMAAVRDIIVRERGDGWVWAHKTGTALAAQPVLGWLVGFTEHDGRSFVFAMNLDLDGDTTLDGQIDPQIRQRLARAILEAEGAL